MSTELIKAPPEPPPEVTRYRLTARDRPSFNTVLDARSLLPGGSSEVLLRNTTRDGGELEIRMEVPLRDGRVEDTLTLAPRGDRLLSSRLLREVFNDAGETVRREDANLASRVLHLPDTIYPEVMLPFVLRWQPFDGETRTLHAWINDRFVARVYYQTSREVTIDLPGGRRRAVPCTMYPDLNDWVPLGNIINRLARPLIPRYHIWFAPESPWEVLRFEGPYGPPGAPEIVLEWLG